MEDQILLRVPPRVAEPIRRFINGEADADVALEPLGELPTLLEAARVS